MSEFPDIFDEPFVGEDGALYDLIYEDGEKAEERPVTEVASDITRLITQIGQVTGNGK